MAQAVAIDLSILGLLRRKEWPRKSSWQVRRNRPRQKEKEQSGQFRVPDNGGERVKVRKSGTLVRKREIRARA